jgi:hypothetical protein
MKTQKIQANVVSLQEIDRRLACFQMAMRDFVAALDCNCIIASTEQTYAMLQNVKAYSIIKSFKRGEFMIPTQLWTPQSVVGVFKSLQKYIQCRDTKVQYNGHSLIFECKNFKILMGVIPYHTKPRVVLYVSKMD